MLIFDGDFPMAPEALDLKRDVTLPLAEMRRRDRHERDIAMASLPEMRVGGVAAAIMKIASDGGRTREGHSVTGPLPPYRAYAVGRGQAAFYEALEAMGEIQILRTSADVSEHFVAWERASDAERMRLPVGSVLGLEGTDSVVDGRLDEWWEDGFRLLSIGHYGPSPYGNGTGMGTDAGLTEQGPALMREMDRLGMLLDVTHTSDRSVREALEHFGGPLLATHSNVRALARGERQLPDDLIQAVIDRDGVIGASMDCWMIHPTADAPWGADVWPNQRKIFGRHEVTLEHLANHVDYVNQMAGDAQHAGIGGDTDGQGGRENAPFEIDTVADYNKLAEIFGRRGYSADDVENLMYRNWVRLFERALPGGAGVARREAVAS